MRNQTQSLSNAGWKRAIEQRIPTAAYQRGQRVMQQQRQWRTVQQRKRQLAPHLEMIRAAFGATYQKRLAAFDEQELAAIENAQPLLTNQLTHEPTVTVVMLSYNRWQLTKACLDSLYANTHYPFETLIFDNASGAETLAWLDEAEATYPNLRVVRHSENLGVGGGRRSAAELVQTDKMVILDNDMVLHRGWLEPLVGCAVRRNAAFVGSLILDPDGAVWAAGANLVEREGGEALEIEPLFHNSTPDQIQQLFAGREYATTFLFGGAGLYDMQVYRDLDGIANYFVGWEDVDFSLKLGAANHQVWVAPRSVVTHNHQWKPQNNVDRDYVQTRYAAEQLRRSEAAFTERWGKRLFSQQVEQDTRELVAEKLAVGERA